MSRVKLRVEFKGTKELEKRWSQKWSFPLSDNQEFHITERLLRVQNLDGDGKTLVVLRLKDEFLFMEVREANDLIHLNGKAVKLAKVSKGDRMMIGEQFLIEVTQAPSGSVSLVTENPLLQEATRLATRDAVASKIIQESEPTLTLQPNLLAQQTAPASLQPILRTTAPQQTLSEEEPTTEVNRESLAANAAISNSVDSAEHSSMSVSSESPASAATPVAAAPEVHTYEKQEEPVAVSSDSKAQQGRGFEKLKMHFASFKLNPRPWILTASALGVVGICGFLYSQKNSGTTNQVSANNQPAAPVVNAPESQTVVAPITQAVPMEAVAAPLAVSDGRKPASEPLLPLDEGISIDSIRAKLDQAKLR